MPAGALARHPHVLLLVTPSSNFRSIRIYPSQLPITLASLEDAVANVAGTVRENVRLRRAFFLPRPTGGVVASYLHQGAGEGLGRIAALVVLAPRDPGAELAGPAAEAAADLARKLGMQVVASAPRFLDREGVDPVAVEEERQVLRSQALGSGMLGGEHFSRGWGVRGCERRRRGMEIVRPCNVLKGPGPGSCRQGVVAQPGLAWRRARRPSAWQDPRVALAACSHPGSLFRSPISIFSPPLCRQAGVHRRQDGDGALAKVLPGGVPPGAAIRHGRLQEGERGSLVGGL